jgi:hypothetical protein
MKTLMLALTLMTFGLAAQAATWNSAPLIDKACSRKAAADPDAHTKDCAMQCAGSGFGILTQKGDFLKFDKAGDQQALQLLKSTDKKDHLRVNVDGDEKDGVIAVKSVKMAE